jgi:hypothetical protein
MRPTYLVRCANAECRQAVEPDSEYGRDFLIFCSAQCAEKRHSQTNSGVPSSEFANSGFANAAMTKDPRLDIGYAKGRLALMRQTGVHKGAHQEVLSKQKEREEIASNDVTASEDPSTRVA